MEKTMKALEVQRCTYNRIYDTISEMLLVPERNLIELQGDLRLLEQKLEAINELNQLRMDMMFSSEEDIQKISREVEINDEFNSKFYKLKLRVEQFLRKSDNCSMKFEKRLKLPNIEFKKFGGELKDWIPFWSQFRRIHEDPDLEDEDKFQYLLQATIPCSRARQLVESYPCCKVNYSKVIESLQKRFGREDLLVEVYVRELLKLVLNNLGQKNRLSTFFDKVESQLRALETLGVKSDTCAPILYPLVESCIGEGLIRVWQRSPLYDEDSNLKVRLDNLMKFLRKEVENEERISLAVSGFEVQNRSRQKSDITTGKSTIPVATDLFNKNKLKCIFCKAYHSSEDCSEALKLTLSQRKQKLTENGCCHSCMKFGHISRRCRVNVICSFCKGRHVKLLCWKCENTKPLVSTDVVPLEKSLSNHTYAEVFLQTLAVQLNGDKMSRQVRVLIDTGSQKSYISKAAALEMGYKSVRDEHIIHSLFGGDQTEIVKHSCYRIRLSDLHNNFACNFESLDQQIICNHITPIKKGPWLEELKYLGIEITDVLDGPIEVLIGSDIAGKLFTGKRHELSCGLVAMQTLLGWVLMGKVSPDFCKSTDITTKILTSMFSQTSNFAIQQLWSLDVLGIRNPVEANNKMQNEKEVMEHFF